MKKAWMVLFVYMLMVTACVPSGKPQSTATIIVLPSETSVPTSTPIPTKTPIPPTPTITPPDLLMKYLNNPRITYVDSENRGPSGGLGPAKKVDGYIELTGKDWNGFAFDREFTENQGIMVNFKFTYGADFEMLFDKGQFYTDSYKRFGTYLHQAYVQTNRWDGKQLTANNLKGNFYLQPDTWYSLLMTIGENGKFLAVIWDPQDSSQYIWNYQVIDSWEGITWTLRFGANKGTIQWDQYSIIEFDSIKDME